jgi:hypothetical protein
MRANSNVNSMNTKAGNTSSENHDVMHLRFPLLNDLGIELSAIVHNVSLLTLQNCDGILCIATLLDQSSLFGK